MIEYNDRKRNSGDISGSVYLISSDGQTLSLPIPSTSPLDPLSWPYWKRARVYMILVYFAVITTSSIQAPDMLNKSLSHDFTPAMTAPFDLHTLMVAPTVMLGVGTLIWIPLSMAIGRRRVLLICTILMAVATVWAAAAPNFYNLLAAVCLQGLAGGFTFSAAILVVIDITFIHERPKALAAFWCFGPACTLILLTLIQPLTNGGTEWHRFYVIWAFAAVAAVLLAAFAYPETFFLRPNVAYDGRILVQSSTEKVRIYEDWRDVPGGPKSADADGARGGWRAMLRAYPQVLLCLCNPLLFWTMILNAINFGGMMSIGTTFGFVLRSPPYSLPGFAIPLVNLAAAFGSLLAYPASGPLITCITKRLTLRNAGVRDAEQYLPAFGLPVLAGGLSCVLYGLTVENRWHPGFVYVSYALNSFSYSSLGAAITLWVIEAFPRWAAAALVAVTGTGYVASFSMSAAVLPWIASQGFAGTNLQIAAGIFAVGAVAVPISFWGRSLRQYIHGRWGDFEAGALRPQADV